MVDLGFLTTLRRREILGLLLVSVLIYYVQAQMAGDKPDYEDVTIERARELIENKPDMVILDVRTEGEFDGGHIGGAINIPVDNLEQRIGELDDKDEMLVYCRTGNRSARAMGILRDNGFTKLYHMVDGIEGWKVAGHPTVK